MVTTKRVIDVDSILWLLDSGGDITKETIREMAEELRSWREYDIGLKRNGCGHADCGFYYYSHSEKDLAEFDKILTDARKREEAEYERKLKEKETATVETTDHNVGTSS
jgi:hypothetical protein